MSKVLAGDLVKVTNVHPDFTDYGYEVGDIFKVLQVSETYANYKKERGAILDVEGGIELYESEVEVVGRPMETLDTDEEYTEIVKGLSQAIADKAREMGADQQPQPHAMKDEVSLADLAAERGAPVSYLEKLRELEDNDVVNAPNHYVNSGIEPIEYMADKLPAYDDGFLAFCIGNVIKYVSRAPHKHETPLEDMRKAAKYLEFAIKHEEKKNK